MSTIDPNSSQAAIFAKLGISQTPETQKAKKDTLGQSDFLKLMTQLQNQDPFAPMDNGDFIAQMAQFSTVTGIQEINNSIGGLLRSLIKRGLQLPQISWVIPYWCQVIPENLIVKVNSMGSLTYLRVQFQQNLDIWMRTRAQNCILMILDQDLRV